MISRLTVFALFAALVGCAGLTGPREDFSIYALNPPMPAGEGSALDWQLLVEEPHVSDLLNDFRIVIATADNERQVYKGARWIERTPSLLQGIWLRAFEADGRLPGAARAGTGVRADLILSTDVIDFQAREQNGSAIVEVQVQARLIDPHNRRIRARQMFQADIPTASNQIAAIVTGFETALAQINAELVAWTLREGQHAIDTAKNGSS